MGSVIRIGSGGTVQVRAGVLQGVGPVGPKGAKGDRGDRGPMGVDGPTGPAGSLSELLSVARLTTPQSVTAGTTVNLAWNTVERDDFGVFTSTTIITPNEIGGVYVLSAFVQVDKPANPSDGHRLLTIVEDGAQDVILDADSKPPVPDGPTFLSVSAAFEARSGCVYRLTLKSTDDLAVAVAAGRVSVNRIGAGPAGPEGPAGPAGPVGPQGIQGPEGPAGDANSGFDTFEDLRSL